jgi:CheY-like chemotaxis protein
MESARRLMRRSERKGQDISPERFWDNSVMLFQQRPRFDAPPGGRAPLRPHPALPQGLARLLALLDASVSELHECGNPADLAGKLGPVREALAGLQAGVRAPGVPVPDAGCAGAGEAVEVRRISLLCPEPEMRELLRDVTEELGFEVVAMEPSSPPAKGARLVLISWDSPDSTPQDALRKCAGIPAVVMQGYLQQADWPDLDHDAALAVLKKPFRIDELNEVVLRLAGEAGTAGLPAQADCPA